MKRLLLGALAGAVLLLLLSTATRDYVGMLCGCMQGRDLEDMTRLLSFLTFTWIVYILTGILIVFLVVGCRTRMQRAWRSKVVAFNLIVWRQLLLTLTHRDGIPQPWAIIFWIVAIYFVLDFATGFYETWIRPIYVLHPALKPILIVLSIGLVVLSFQFAIISGMF